MIAGSSTSLRFLGAGYRRLLNAHEPRERHDAAYYLFEVLLKYVASIAVADYLESEEREHRVNAALKGLARPSLGEWLGFLRECARFSRQRKDPLPAARAVADFLERKEDAGTETVRLFNALRSFLSGKPSQKESASLERLRKHLDGRAAEGVARFISGRMTTPTENGRNDR